MAPHSTAGISRAVRWGDYHQWAPSPFGTLIVDMLERPGHLGSPAFRNDAASRCSEPVNSLRKVIFFYSQDNAPYYLIRTEIADAHQHEHCRMTYGVSARRA